MKIKLLKNCFKGFYVENIRILISTYSNRILIISSILIFTGCMAPINLSFDSAKMIKKGGIEVQANSSYYPEYEQFNYGAKIGLGVSNKYNVKLRYEALLQFEIETSYFEIENKVKLADWAAFSLPIGVYIEEDIFVFDPRLPLTFSPNKTVDFSIIPKCHIFPMVNLYLGLVLEQDLVQI